MPGVIESIVSAISTDLVTSLAAASYPPLVDGGILLGRQHQFTQSGPPRVIMYPVDSVYGPRSPASASNVATNTPYSTESATQIAQRSIGTDGIVFEVQCWGWQPDQTDPQTVPDGNFDYTRILAHAVLQSIQRLMPGNPVVMGQQGHWPGSEMNSTQLDVLGRLFIFRTQPVPTPILDKLLPFVVPGTAGVIKTYITTPDNPTPSSSSRTRHHDHQERIMTTSGEVQITVLDGGASIVVPANNVQLVIGFASLGTATAGQIIATTQPQSLQTALGYGALPEAAALSVLAGGVVLAIPLAKTATGTAEAVTAGSGNTGTSVVTVTPDGTNGAFDDYYVFMKIVTGGTRGTSGWTFQLSLDAGRTFGPVILPGTAVTYAIPNTGLTLAFAAGTFVANDTFKFATTGPSISTANIQTALNTFAASQYAIAGIGSIHIVGSTIATVGTQQGMSGANATTIDGFMTTLANGYVFSRAIISARDSAQPTAYGGAGETDATWTAAIATDYSAVSAKRICACAGYYNMPSAFPNAAAGTPRYRRPLAWALAARQVAIPPQRHAGRVRDGALTQIAVDPSNDPKDGFNYHDERTAPGLDAARFTSARTRFGKQGYFIQNPNLMSPSGSDFTILPRGIVMDVACGIAHEAGEEEINDDVRLNPSGTLYVNDALTIQNGIQAALTDNMLATSEISGSTVVVDQTANVGATSKVPINIVIQGRGYILEEDITIGFQNGNAAS